MMKRRAFLAALGIAPFIRVPRAAARPRMRSVSDALKESYGPTFVRIGVGRYSINLGAESGTQVAMTITSVDYRNGVITMTTRR